MMQENTLKIIRADKGHFDRVYALLCELEESLIDRDALEAVYLNNIEDPAIGYYLAVQGGEIVGFASVHIQSLLHHAGKIAEVQELIVARAHQGLGIGSLLFDHIRAVCTERGCPQLEVCCRQTRTRSHGFYQKQGMQNTHDKFTLKL